MCISGPPYNVSSWQWCGVGERRILTVSWPACLLPRGSASRWLQTTVSLDLGSSGSGGPRPDLPGTVHGDVLGQWRMVFSAVCFGVLESDSTCINQSDMWLSLLQDKRSEALTPSCPDLRGSVAWNARGSQGHVAGYESPCWASSTHFKSSSWWNKSTT